MEKALFSLALLMSVLHLFGQNDQPTYGYHYQAIIRNGSTPNSPVAANQPVALRFRILTASNQNLYEETHNATTDPFGRVAMVVGTGTPAGSARFDTLNWAARKHFLNVEVKIGGAGDWVGLGKEEIILPPAALYSNDMDLVGFFPLMGDGDGNALVTGSSWQRVSRATYTGIQAFFNNIKPVQTGKQREYYLIIRKADNVDACAENTEWRFWFDWAGKPGHVFNVPRDWGELEAGRTYWVKVPSDLKQFLDLGYTGERYFSLEARMQNTCASKSMLVFSIDVCAIDRINGSQPATVVSTSNTQGAETRKLIGPGGKIQFHPSGLNEVYGTFYIKDALIADVSNFSGSSGRDAIFIRASPDNGAGVIVVNKPKLAFWNSQDSKAANLECGTLTILGNDRAHFFPTVQDQPIPPGTVVVFDEAQPGRVRPCTSAYDHKIPGVVSDLKGEGKYRPGIVHAQDGTDSGVPVALDGTVEVLAVGPVAIGDYLTTSAVPGHAMAAKNRRKAEGALIGRAITPLAKGEKGKVDVFVGKQ